LFQYLKYFGGFAAKEKGGAMPTKGAGGIQRKFSVVPRTDTAPETTEGKLRIAPRFHLTSIKPKIHPVKNAYREKDCTSKQESPHTITEAGEYVREPCKQTSYANNPTHRYLLS